MSTPKHNLYIFFQLNRILTELHRSFFYLSFFQEKTLGDISFKLETKIMNFMSFYFLKKYNQVTQVLSIICNTICFHFPIVPLCRVWVCFYGLHHVFLILSVILTKYHYIILTDYPGSNFIDIFLKLY